MRAEWGKLLVVFFLKRRTFTNLQSIQPPQQILLPPLLAHLQGLKSSLPAQAAHLIGEQPGFRSSVPSCSSHRTSVRSILQTHSPDHPETLLVALAPHPPLPYHRCLDKDQQPRADGILPCPCPSAP